MIGTLTTALATIEIVGCDDCTEAFAFADEARARGFRQTGDGDWNCEDCADAQAAAPAGVYDRAYV